MTGWRHYSAYIIEHKKYEGAVIKLVSRVSIDRKAMHVLLDYIKGIRLWGREEAVVQSR